MAKVVEIAGRRIKISKVNAVLRKLQKLCENGAPDVLDRYKRDASSSRNGFLPQFLGSMTNRDHGQLATAGLSYQKIDPETRAIVMEVVVEDGIVRLPGYNPTTSQKSPTPNPA